MVTDRTVMTDTQIHGVEKSASGKENGYIHQCTVVEHHMSYAACLSRIDAIKAGKGMADWKPCEVAMSQRTCRAVQMREEELLKGKAIFFTPRGAIEKAISSAREWISSWNKKAAPEPVAAPRKPRDMLDAMGELGSFADAISTATAPTLPTAPVLVALPGETPLQMARRLAGERKK
jgi:hypothetical protein